MHARRAWTTLLLVCLQPRFFTVSASCKESQLDAYGPALRTVVESFSQPALKYY